MKGLTQDMLEQVDLVIMENIDNVTAVKALIKVKKIIKEHEIIRHHKTTKQITTKEKIMGYIHQMQDAHRRVTQLSLIKKFKLNNDEAKGYLAMSK